MTGIFDSLGMFDCETPPVFAPILDLTGIPDFFDAILFSNYSKFCIVFSANLQNLRKSAFNGSYQRAFIVEFHIIIA